MKRLALIVYLLQIKTRKPAQDGEDEEANGERMTIVAGEETRG